MRRPEAEPAVQTLPSIRRAARELRRMVRDTPACAAAFGALIGGLGSMTVLSQIGDARLLVEVFAPSWAVIAVAEVAGAAIALAKVRNRQFGG